MRTKFERTRSAVHHGNPYPQVSGGGNLLPGTAPTGRGQRTIQSIRLPEEEVCMLAQPRQGEGSARFNQSEIRRRISAHSHGVSGASSILSPRRAEQSFTSLRFLHYRRQP